MTRRSRAEMIESTRAKLLEAARNIFIEQGYAGASMDELTASVGLTRGALYHHFGSKEGLLLAVLEKIELEVEAVVQQAEEAAPSLWEGLRSRCRKYIELSLDPGVRRIILQDAKAVFGGISPRAQSMSVIAFQKTLQQLMEKNIVRQMHTESMARMLDGAVTEASFWIAEDDTSQKERLALALDSLEYLLAGLRQPAKVVGVSGA